MARRIWHELVWCLVRFVQIIITAAVVMGVSLVVAETVIPYVCSLIATDVGLSSITTTSAFVGMWLLPCLCVVLFITAGTFWFFVWFVRFGNALVLQIRARIADDTSEDEQDEVLLKKNGK